MEHTSIGFISHSPTVGDNDLCKIMVEDAFDVVYAFLFVVFGDKICCDFLFGRFQMRRR